MDNSPRKALIVSGGWAGHEPEKTAPRFQRALETEGFEVTLSNSLDSLLDGPFLNSLSLLVPMWTMGTLPQGAAAIIRQAVAAGVGLAGFHGGMGDAFRGSVGYQELVGGQFLHHAHVGPYTVTVTQPGHPCVTALPAHFTYDSEQYYLMTDPRIDVLATTDYTYEGTTTRMPQIWTHHFGNGRAFYSALGHKDAEFDTYPHVLQMTVDGMLWAAR